MVGYDYMAYMPMEEIIKTFEFNDAEKALVEQWRDSSHEAVIASQILAAKKYEQAIDRLIVSNEKVAESNEKYSNATILLTIVIIIATITGLYIEYQKFEMEIATQLIGDNIEGKKFVVQEMKKRSKEIIIAIIALAALFGSILSPIIRSMVVKNRKKR
jgi:hypothetical protein